MKILYSDLGGVYKYNCDKTSGRVLGWNNSGHDVSILFPSFMREEADLQICDIANYPDKIKIITFPFSGIKVKSTLGIIASYFVRVVMSPVILFKNIDHIETGFSNSAFIVDTLPILILKLFGKCDHWFLMMDSVVPPPSERSGSKFVNIITYIESRAVAKLAKYFATAVFTVNPVLRDQIISMGINPNKIILSKNGLFIDRINQSYPSSNNYTAAYMGRISDNKGVFDLINVWKKIVNNFPDAKLAILGTGRSDVVARFAIDVEKNNLTENIDILGYVSNNDKYKILKSSRLFLFLSKVNKDESWGISLMEALACGLPAVTYDLDIYKHVYPEKLLLKSEIGDLDSITDDVMFLLNSEKNLNSISEKGIKFARQFSWNNIADNDIKEICRITSC